MNDKVKIVRRLNLPIWLAVLFLTACAPLLPFTIASRPALPTQTPTEQNHPTQQTEPMPSLQTIRADNASQIARVGQLGKGAIHNYAWSSDGKTIALTTSLGVYLYDASTLTQKQFIAIDAEAFAIAFNTPGTSIAASLADNTVRVWDAPSGNLVHTFTQHTQPSLNVAFSPNAPLLASLGREGKLRMWNTDSGAEVYALTVAPDSRFAFSPDGRFIANGGGKFNRRVLILDAASGKLARQIEIAPDLGGMAFSLDSQWLAFSEANNNAVLTNMNTGQTLRLQHAGFVNNVMFSPDSSLLATTGSEKTVRFWDVRTTKSVRELKGYSEATTTVAFNANGDALAAMDATGDFRIWDLRSGQSFNHQSFLPRGGKLQFSPRENRVAFLQGESLTVFDMNKTSHRLLGHAGQTCALAFSADAKLLASGDTSGLIHLWDLNSGNAVRVLAGHRGPVCELSFRRDGTLLASRSVNEDLSVRLWDVATGQNLNVFSSDSNYQIAYLGFSRDDTILVATGIPGVVVSNLATGARRVVERRAVTLFRVALSSDGKRLAYSDFEDNVVILNLDLDEKSKLSARFNQGAATLAFSRDDKVLLTGDQADMIRLWNVETGQLLQTIQGRGIDVVLNPDGTLIAFKPSSFQRNASFNEIAVWNVATNQRIHQLSGGERPLAFSPDGRVLTSGSTKGTITLWGAK